MAHTYASLATLVREYRRAASLFRQWERWQPGGWQVDPKRQAVAGRHKSKLYAIGQSIADPDLVDLLHQEHETRAQIRDLEDAGEHALAYQVRLNLRDINKRIGARIIHHTTREF